MGHIRSVTPRPHWCGLYVRLLAGAGAAALLTISLPASTARTTLGCALAIAVVLAALDWNRRNAAALDLEAWCDCAPATVTARVVESRRPVEPRRPQRRRRRGATLPV
jgi:hypothetical protein